MKISALSIGTELTTGQILNRNGQWISQKFKELGIETSFHLVVPDDRQLILEALRFCSEHSDHIFVTGGIGPTSDDFTREVIAEWTGKPLKWDEKSWVHIHDRLVPRGIVVKEIQKQQCYFPDGSTILTNQMGTANAFFLSYEGREIFVLPGPPRELEALWQDFIAHRMIEKTKDLDPLITTSWDTIGLGESDVADRAEAALIGCSFDKGYRVHMPFVEFKLTYPKSNSLEAKEWIEKLDEALGPITALKNGEDAASKVSELFLGFEKVLIIDEIPGSFLMHRLFPFSKKLLREKKLNFLSSPLAFVEDPNTLLLTLKEDCPGKAKAGLKWQLQNKYMDIESPFKSQLLKEREQQYYAEMALIFWMQEILSSHNR